MKIYISGPITGIELEDCHIAFGNAEHELKSKGHEVVNPLQVTALDCLRPETCKAEESGHDWLCWMRADIREMMSCDAVYALSGWQQSRGASVEIGLADSLGVPVYYEDIVQDMPIPRCTI